MAHAPRAGFGRLYAPRERYVLVPNPLTALLVIERTDAAPAASTSPRAAPPPPPAIRVAPVDELDALIGPSGKRAQSCAVAAVVGLLAYPDDHSLVVVTESAPREDDQQR